MTKDDRSLIDKDRFYFKWIKEIIIEGLHSGEFKDTSSPEELLDLYTMYERALIYDWVLLKGRHSLTEYSGRLLPHVLDVFVQGI